MRRLMIVCWILLPLLAGASPSMFGNDGTKTSRSPYHPTHQTSAGTRRPYQGNVFRLLPSVGATSLFEGGGVSPTSSLGVPVTYTRSTARSCVRADGRLNTLSANQPCVTSPGYALPPVTNLLKWSEAIDNAAWVKNAPAQATVNADVATAPDGTLTADRITWTNVGGVYNLYQIITVTGGQTYTASLYLRKVSGGDWYRLMFYDGNTNQARVWVNLATGQMGTSGSGGTGTFAGASVTPVGDGWYRVAVAGSIQTTAGYVQVTPQVGDNNTTQLGGGSYEIWGAQLEKGATASRYVLTTSAAWTDSDVANYLIWSEQLQRWTTGGATAVADQAVAPNGTRTAELVTSSVNSGYLRANVVNYAGGTATFSTYMRAVSGTAIPQVEIYDITASVSRCTSSGGGITDAGWKRVACTASGIPAGNLLSIVLRPAVNATGSAYMWGAQFDSGAQLERYLPTEAVPVDTTQVTNLFLHSEEMEHTIWQRSASTIGINAIPDADGNLTAEKISADGTAAVHGIYQNILKPSTPYTVSVDAKAGEETSMVIANDGTGAITVNLNTCAVTAGGAGTEYNVFSLGNGWCRTVWSFTTVGGASTALAFRLRVNAVFTGTGGLYLARASVTQSATTARTYVRTWDLPGTSVAPQRQLEVASAVTNSLLYSDALNTGSSWLSTGAGACTVTADQATIPGSNAAFMDRVSCSTGADYLYQTTAITGTNPVTASGWLHATTTNAQAVLGLDLVGNVGTATCSCTTSDGRSCTAGLYTGTRYFAVVTLDGPSATPIRVSLTCTPSSATTSTAIWLFSGHPAGTNAAMDYGNLQLESNASSPGRYVQTAGTAASSNGDNVQLALPGYSLVHNLAGRSEELGTAGTWGGFVAVTDNAIMAPDGNLTADLLTRTTTGTGENRSQSFTLASGGVYTFSVYLRASANSAQAALGIYCGAWMSDPVARLLSGPGTIGLPAAVGPAFVSGLSQTEWTRVSYTATVNTSACGVYLYPDGNGSTTLGNATYAWGAQLEPSPRAGPYVRTTVGASSPTLVPNVLQVQNLLSSSEQLDQVGWSKARLTVTPVSIENPIGGQVYRLTEDASLNTHYISAGTTIPDNTTYTCSVYAKAGERTYLYAETADKAGNFFGQTFDLSAGTLRGAGTVGVARGIEALGNGWYRVSLSSNSGTGAVRPTTPCTWAPWNGATSYQGDGTSGLYLTGTQLEVGVQSPGPYVKTTSTAAALLLQGVSGPGVQPTPANNLLISSEQIGSTGWSPSSSPAVITDNWVAPDGTKSGDTIVDDSSSSEGYVQAFGTTVGQFYTFSCWLRAGTISSVRLTGPPNSCTFTDLTSTPTRRSCSAVAVATTSTYGIYPGAVATDTGTVDVWGCQVEPGGTAGPYVRTTSTAGAQVTLPAPNPPIQSTLANAYPINLVQRSEEFDNSAWTVTSTATKGTANAAVAPDNSGTTADEVLQGSIDGAGIEQAFTGDGTQVTLSIWARTASGSYTGTLGSGIWNSTAASWACQPGVGQTVDTTWRRYSCTAVAPAGNVMRAVAWRFPSAAIAPQGTSVYIWGAQLESGSYPGPYVKTPTALPITNAILQAGNVTNLVLQSEALGVGASWVGTTTVTSDAVVAPDGTTTADLVVKNTTATSDNRAQSLTLTQGQVYTLSIYARASNTSTKVDFGLYCASFPPNPTVRVLSGPGTIGIGGNNTARLTGLSTTEWTRASITVPALGASCQVYLYPDTIPSTTAGNGLYLWGIQLEQGWAAGPYVKTAAATASYAYSPLTNDSEGCVRACFRITSAPTLNNSIVWFGLPSGAATGALRLNQNSTTTITLSDVTATATITVADMRDRDVCVRGWWSAALGLKGIEELGTGVKQTIGYDGTIASPSVWLGNGNGGTQLNGKLWDVALGSRKDACK